VRVKPILKKVYKDGKREQDYQWETREDMYEWGGASIPALLIGARRKRARLFAVPFFKQ
jgi:hypothetical protein